MTEKFSSDESLFLNHFLKDLKIQVDQPFPKNGGITKEKNHKCSIFVDFSLKEFKRKCEGWDHNKITKIMQSLKNKGIIKFCNSKMHFVLILLDHASLLKEFGYV